MPRKEYSAGMVKLSFWFSEFRKVISLLSSGETAENIRELNRRENIFAAPSVARGIQIQNTVIHRVESLYKLDQKFLLVFEGSDVSTQKLIVLIAVMNTDSLFFDFIHEVFRDKLIIGDEHISDADISVFFRHKQLQSEKVAGWTDMTLNRLRICYKTILAESGLTDRASDARKILRPILDRHLEDYLKSNGMEVYISALTGRK